LLGTDKLDGTLENFILEKTDGVPFFIEELVRSLKELEFIKKINNVFCIARQIDEIAIPETVQDIITVRIDALPDQAKQLLQTAAVVGRVFSHELIAKVQELSREELLSNLSILKDAEHIYERGVYPRSAYFFKHALTQEVAYNSLLLKKRKALHEKIGDAIRQLNRHNLEEHYEMLAYHYSRSENNDKALEYLEQANRKAAGLCAMKEADAYFKAAMHLLDKLEETGQNRLRRISMLAKQGTVAELLFKFKEYYDLLVRNEPLSMKLDHPELSGAYHGQLGHCHFAFGHYDQAIGTLTRAAALCKSAGNVIDATHAYAYLMLSHLDRGDYGAVMAVKKDLVQMGVKSSNLRWYVRGLSAAGNAYAHLGDWGDAVKEGQTALKLALRYADDNLASLAASSLSLSHCWQGNSDEALKVGRLAVEKATTPGDQSRSKRSLGWAMCRAGQVKKGIELLTEATLPIFQSGGFRAFEIPLRCYLGEGYRLAGNEEKAVQTFRAGLEMAKRSGAKFYIGFASRHLARLIFQKDPHQAELLIKKSIRILEQIKAENETAMALVDYGWLCRAQENMHKAQELFNRAVEIFERLGTVIDRKTIAKR
jgi:tetratricopeptide (TPR) repeat protein